MRHTPIDPALSPCEVAGSLVGIRAGERMTRPVVAVSPDVSAAAAWRIMGERRVRRLPVLDTDGRLVGIVTERDLHRVAFEGRGGAGPEEVAVADVMSHPVVTVEPAADLCEAARLMDEHRIGAVPVVEDARVVGMLTRTDVVQGLVARVSSPGPPGAAPGRST